MLTSTEEADHWDVTPLVNMVSVLHYVPPHNLPPLPSSCEVIILCA